MSESSSGPSAMTAPAFVERSMVLPTWQRDALGDLAARQEISIRQLLRRSIAPLVREAESTAATPA